MVTFEVSIEDSTYELMIRELRKMRLIDEFNMTRNEFVNLAIIGLCYDLKISREKDENNLTIWGHSVKDE